MYCANNSKLIGILNDFDLAAVMDPGKRCPPRTGYERTGTLAFMALDLLQYCDGEMSRWYRHDLESFTWVLYWEMFKFPYREWTEGTFSQVFSAKRSVMNAVSQQLPNLKLQWKLDLRFITSWFWSWINLIQTTNVEMTTAAIASGSDKALTGSEVLDICHATDTATADTVHIRAAVECAKNIRESSRLEIPALLDTTWIDVVLVQPGS